MNVNEKHKNSVFIKLVNDISFLLDDRLVVLIEHQSTINENMPIRLLQYLMRLYEQIIGQRQMFQTKLVKFPSPVFIVLYNGTRPYPEYKELRLSTAFMDVNDLKKQNQCAVSLELTVQVYNINYGQNKHILEKCKNLDGYSILMEKIREENKTKSLEDSIKSAIEWCLEHNVLIDFLRRYGSEVTNMFVMSLPTEELVEISREEGREEGILEIARNLKEMGEPINKIQTATGLSIEAIEKL